MQMSIGVEYALHSLFYMVNVPTGNNIGMKELAKLNSISETYLSKIFTKLKKSGLVRSITGVKGGYELAKDPKNISFWDIIESVEGSNSFFQCAEIRQRNILSVSKDENYGCPCLIKTVMDKGQNKMKDYLKNKSLYWLHKEAYKDFSEEKIQSIEKWTNEILK